MFLLRLNIDFSTRVFQCLIIVIVISLRVFPSSACSSCYWPGPGVPGGHVVGLRQNCLVFVKETKTFASQDPTQKG